MPIVLQKRTQLQGLQKTRGQTTNVHRSSRTIDQKRFKAERIQQEQYQGMTPV